MQDQQDRTILSIRCLGEEEEKEKEERRGERREGVEEGAGK
jgi:hypothetical protein